MIYHLGKEREEGGGGWVGKIELPDWSPFREGSLIEFLWTSVNDLEMITVVV